LHNYVTIIYCICSSNYKQEPVVFSQQTWIHSHHITSYFVPLKKAMMQNNSIILG